jgi:hypothetical protein
MVGDWPASSNLDKVPHQGLAKYTNRVVAALAMMVLFMAALRVPALVRP